MQIAYLVLSLNLEFLQTLVPSQHQVDLLAEAISVKIEQLRLPATPTDMAHDMLVHRLLTYLGPMEIFGIKLYKEQ